MKETRFAGLEAALDSWLDANPPLVSDTLHTLANRVRAKADVVQADRVQSVAELIQAIVKLSAACGYDLAAAIRGTDPPAPSPAAESSADRSPVDDPKDETETVDPPSKPAEDEAEAPESASQPANDETAAEAPSKPAKKKGRAKKASKKKPAKK